MKTLKKVVAIMFGLVLFFSSLYSVDVLAVSQNYSSVYTEIEAANVLASKNIINDNSANPISYRLNDTISRREILKIMMRLKWDLDWTSINFESKAQCSGNKFNDLPNLGSKTDWACYYAEPALEDGMISSNINFNPNSRVTKAEALKFVMKERWIEPDAGSGWEPYISAAIREGILTSSFSDYNTQAERGWIFTLAANAIDSTLWDDISDCDLCPVMCILDDSCDECDENCD